MLTDSAEALQATAVLTGAPFAVSFWTRWSAFVATLGRHERGHRWLVGAARSRLGGGTEDEED
ncbi:hypothetical protein [Natronococcus jeotgali]|uniref:hypothetical protein n=1 Tax=Natronococcus jeotgali TaxID=413812 RepID=UPI0014615941|nr:hypothetical protein [Natronococcus jeotgali]